MEATFSAPPGRSLANFEDLADADPMSDWAHHQYLDKYSWKDENGDPTEVWPDTAYRVVSPVLGTLGYKPNDPEFRALTNAIVQRKFLPGGRYLANTGKQYHQVNNCFLYRAEDSREGWASIVQRSLLSLTSGGGVGVVYSDVRPKGTPIKRINGTASGPLSLAQMVNEVGRHTRTGGNRRSAIWGGLHWWHQDIFDWIKIKDWDEETKRLKAETNGEHPAPLDMTNISVILDTEFFTAYHNRQHERHEQAREVYWKATEMMLKNGEPGFSVNVGQQVDECLRNACTEITSADDNDVCNLGSINLARIQDIEELAEVTRLAVLFLLGGTLYSDVPHDEVRQVREKNRRLGLGLMGMHEWLLVRGYDYEVVPELDEWLSVWEETSDLAADYYSQRHGLSRPRGVRAIAPNGTIGILAETTTGIEPVLYIAYKRRFIGEDMEPRFQYVLDPTVERLRTEHDVDPHRIETAYSMASDPERRIKFLADVQRHVDHGISATINLPEVITNPDWVEHYGEIFLRYLPQLRGLTVYPDGARYGQPFEEVPYSEVEGKLGVTFDDVRDQQCASGVCGV